MRQDNSTKWAVLRDCNGRIFVKQSQLPPRIRIGDAIASEPCMVCRNNFLLDDHPMVVEDLDIIQQ